MKYIGKILPIDGFHVTLHGNLPADYQIALTHLYQPLIGLKAVMLYLTLLHEISIQEKSKLQSHHTLMNYLNLPLDEVYETRLKLEGIGLMNTYKHEANDKTSYLYEIKAPFSPKDFFHDPMLSQLLMHHVGKTKAQELQTHFTRTIDTKHSENVTASFEDVFNTVQLSMEKVKPFTQYQHVMPGINLPEIDFAWMENMLRQRMIPSKRVLTKDNKRIMNQMMVLYKLTNVDIENCVLWALTEENELDIEEFKNACHDLFTATQKQSAIHLTNKSHEVLDKGNNPKKPLTQEEKLIQKLEVISPQQLLADLSSGNQASPQDMKLVREVMATQGLPAPVMNVLIHYVLLQSDMRLSKAYLETIASHWSRANLTTAREAMEFAKKQQEKFTKERSKKQSYRSYQQPALKKEIVPEWFKEQKKEAKQKQSRETEQATVVDLQKQKEEIAAFIKKQTANQRK